MSLRLTTNAKKPTTVSGDLTSDTRSELHTPEFVGSEGTKERDIGGCVWTRRRRVGVSWVT